MRLAAILRSAAATAPPRLTLYTGTRCSLCDEVKEVLTELRAEVGLPAACLPAHPSSLSKWMQGARFELETVNIHDRQDPSTKRWRRLYQVSAKAEG